MLLLLILLYLLAVEETSLILLFGSLILLYRSLILLYIEQTQTWEELKYESALPYSDDSQKGSMSLLYYRAESI